jgi:hypothetical protein
VTSNATVANFASNNKGGATRGRDGRVFI